MKKNCKQCNSEFEAETNQTVYCTKYCLHRAYRNRRSSKTKEEIALYKKKWNSKNKLSLLKCYLKMKESVSLKKKIKRSKRSDSQKIADIEKYKKWYLVNKEAHLLKVKARRMLTSELTNKLRQEAIDNIINQTGLEWYEENKEQINSNMDFIKPKVVEYKKKIKKDIQLRKIL